MDKINNILRFYLLVTSLKNKIRSGSVVWHISKDRLESIAEHTFETCVLAIIVDSEAEYDFDISLDRVLKMLIIHEFGEIDFGELAEIGIGDLTPFDNQGNKHVKEELVFYTLFKDLMKQREYVELFEEFKLIIFVIIISKIV